MEKVLFQKNINTPDRANKPSRGKSEDTSTISSRWKEVVEKDRDNSEGKPQKDNVGKQKGPVLQKQNFADAIDEKPSSLFDLLASLQGEGSDLEMLDASLDEEDLPNLMAAASKGEKPNILSKNTEINQSNLAVALSSDHLPEMGIESSSEGGISAMISPQATEKMSELINKLADEISVMMQGDKTETTITIKNTPLFEGAKVTITEFESASKELNIKFENLTQQAHEVISMQANREALKSALEQKGYNIHIVTASTEVEKAEQTFEAHQQRGGDGQSRERGDEEQKRQKDKED